MIYHFTDTETFFKIVKNDNLEFKASHYSLYKKKDYDGNIEMLTPVIKELCKEANVEFDPDLKFDPYIISFSTEINQKLWRDFGKNHNGIVLELDENIIRQHSLKDCNPDVFMKCGYAPPDIKQWLIKSYCEGYLCPTINNLQDDLMLISACYLKKRYKRQNEYRYMEAFHCPCGHIDINGKIDIKNSDVKETEHFLFFPKEALLGAIIGNKNKKNIKEKMFKHLKYRDYDLSKISIRIESCNN